MRICIISNYNGLCDEGIKKVAEQISLRLQKCNEVLHINLRNFVFSLSSWSKLRQFNPQVLHVFLRPSPIIFTILSAIKSICTSSKIIITSLQPPCGNPFLLKITLLYLKPDVVLVQDHKTYNYFMNYFGFKISFLLGGVDLERFKPVSLNEKLSLREKYGFSKHQYIVLHVGHIFKGRNLDIFTEIQEIPNVQVLLVASTAFQPDSRLLKRLSDAGCLIWQKFISNIEEIYMLADCYVFPTKNNNNAILLPLSVLEAMSCNLPVISSNFGALPEIFNEGEGLSFAKDDLEIIEKFQVCMGNNQEIKTRNKVIMYSWDNLVRDLEELYANVVA